MDGKAIRIHQGIYMDLYYFLFLELMDFHGDEWDFTNHMGDINGNMHIAVGTGT